MFKKYLKILGFLAFFEHLVVDCRGIVLNIATCVLGVFVASEARSILQISFAINRVRCVENTGGSRGGP